jgi:hypothetical protein
MEDLEALAVDPDHLRTLAQRYLEQRGLTVPTEKVDAS